MTKLARLACCLVLLGWLAPPASAHGAAPAREVEQRVLLDADGALGYAGCSDGVCMPGGGLDSGALDLLALDVREFRDANGTALLAFRATAQSEVAQQAGRVIALSFTLNGQPRTLRLEGDGAAFTSADADRAFVSKDVIGDGHAKAIEAWVALARLGAKAGDALTGIQAASFAGATKGDLVPGTWYPANEQEQPVPFVPTSPDATQPGPAGSYTLAGPASLLDLGVDDARPDTSHAAAKLTVTLHNPLKQLPQFVTLRAGGPGLSVSGDALAVNLDAGTTKTVTLSVAGPASELNLTATSDLGGYATLLVPVANSHATAPPAPSATRPPTTGSTPSASSTAAPSSTPTDGASPTKKSPAASPLLLLASLAALATLRGRNKNAFSLAPSSDQRR
ncbi:MAG: hypothetical protein QOI63_2071 [Thermoplasmata archaeon]|jgi:hypothetical protein|nr:hypothetical protein [Thermoplasmata archaeon]